MTDSTITPTSQGQAASQSGAGGMLDQLKGGFQKALAPGADGQPEAVGKAKAFAKERPWATAALVGVLGLATLGTLRGKR